MSVSCVQTDSQADSQEESQSSEDSETVSGPDYNYLLNMMLWYLTKEKKDELLKQRDAKAKELTKLRKMTPPDLWREDLRAFLEELDVSAVSTWTRCRGGIWFVSFSQRYLLFIFNYLFIFFVFCLTNLFNLIS